MGAEVIDGTGAGATAPVAVLIRHGRIEGISTNPESTQEARDTIDVTGRFLVPGFVDAHVHLPPDSAVQDAILHQLVRYGVTTVLIPGARGGAGVGLRSRRTSAMPRMLTAGLILEDRAATDELAGWATPVPNVEAARAEVARQVATGVDFIKYYSGISPELARAIVTEASRSGTPVIAHAGATTWKESAEAGVAMLVHSGWGTPMEELIDLEDPASASDGEWYASYAAAPTSERFETLARTLVARGVTVVPTLGITQAAGLGRDASLLPLFETHLAPEASLPGWWPDGWQTRHPQYGDDVDEEEARLLEEVYWPGVLEITAAFHRAGVRLGVGTDVGNAWITPGASFHYELALYEQAGLPPLAILSMATRNGAQALGLDSLGTVEVGKVADLVVLGSDPAGGIAATRDIELVLIEGEVVFRAGR